MKPASPIPMTVIGLSHHTAPVEVRERLAFAEAELPETLRRAATLASGEALLLSTCNRVELYLAGEAPLDVLRSRVAAFLAHERPFPAATDAPLEPHLYAHQGEAALRHLFRVAASLDSAVVGEPQILGQVKSAFEAAQQASTVGALLGQVLPRALSAAKRVRTETRIARSSSSVASAAVELARRIFGGLDGREVLVVGAGKMGELAARHLYAAGCARLLVVNRTRERAEELAGRMRGVGGAASAHGLDELQALLTRADVVLCSTGAAQPVLSREVVQRAMKARKGRWLCLLDIAVPRDVEPTVGELPNVYLYDVDALTRIATDHLEERRREAERAEIILDEEVARCAESLRSRGVVPTIRALREHFGAVARAEAERTLRRLGSVAEKERREIELLAESIVNKLLHQPLTSLKREAESQPLLDAVRTLFALPETLPETTSGAPPPEPLRAAPSAAPAPHANASTPDTPDASPRVQAAGND